MRSNDNLIEATMDMWLAWMVWLLWLHSFLIDKALAGELRGSEGRIFHSQPLRSFSLNICVTPQSSNHSRSPNQFQIKSTKNLTLKCLCESTQNGKSIDASGAHYHQG